LQQQNIQTLKICYVLSYRAPDYIRSRSILRALRQLPYIELHEAINTSTGVSRYLETFKKTREIKEKHDPDAYFLGFRGHEFYWPLRALVGNKPIILDALMSPFASLSRERKFGALGVAAAAAWRVVERSVLRDANFVLTDTAPHVLFYQQEFSLPPHKLLALPVGAEEPISGVTEKPHDAPSPPKVEMNVLFYGSFLPLHGIDIILEAASLLKDLPIRFDFVGGNDKQARKLNARCTDLGIACYTHRHWVSFDELINVTIPDADLCLGGPFGYTEQARRVITGKTSQCLALGKPTVIGQIDEDTGFVDKQNCLLIPQADPQALADAIRWAFEQRHQLPKIGEQGRSIYAERLSVNVIRQRLGQMLSDLERR
jgi:glycosyltransferase involved in cell wall biosynthesis